MSLEQLNNLLQTQFEVGEDKMGLMIVDEYKQKESGEDEIVVRWIDKGEMLLSNNVYAWQHNCWRCLPQYDKR